LKLGFGAPDEDGDCLEVHIALLPRSEDCEGLEDAADVVAVELARKMIEFFALKTSEDFGLKNFFLKVIRWD